MDRPECRRRLATLLSGGAIALALSTPTGAREVTGVVAQTVRFEELTLSQDRLPVAPEGKSLTLTVNGTETPLTPGHWTGDIVLSVSSDIPVKYRDLPEHRFRTALYVIDGKVDTDRSVLAAAGSPQLEPGVARDARIISRGDLFNGFIATGNGAYTLARPMIDMIGNGGNDFAGFGAAIMATGNVELTVNRPIIRTRGAVRTALFTGGNATMRVNDADIEVFNGTLPPDYKFTIDVGKMMEVPWMLGLSGNVRASNLVDNGTLYITNSHIRAQGWGAVSTDDNKRVRMYVKDSLIEAVETGYGAYSIGDSLDHFSHSVIRAADIGGIIAGEASITLTDRTVVEAGLYGIMMHSGIGGGTLTIDKGSSLHAGRTAIQVKGRGTTIVVDDARITADGGVVLQAMDNDDPFMAAMARGETPPGMSAPPPGVVPDGSMGGGEKFSPDVIATFRKTMLMGDIYNGRATSAAMRVRFENAGIVGRISVSRVAPASGVEPARGTYREIGNVRNTPVSAKGTKGLALSFDSSSRWTVTGTSHLSELAIEPGAQIVAPQGKTLSFSVNGRMRPIKPGRYKGQIMLSAN